MNSNESAPIFVRGLSRSGGTLLVTLLDSHPQVSMSYELYPSIFDTSLTRDYLVKLAEIMSKDNYNKSLTIESAPAFTKFILRAERSGIYSKKLAALIKTHLEHYHDFQSQASKYGFIALCGKQKMHDEAKLYWGSKCTNSFYDYLEIWPTARFINIIRDGRDVLASQMNTGSFRHTPKDLGISWSKTHQKFRQLISQVPKQAFEIKYENLVRFPDVELRALMQKLGLPFDEALLNHENSDLTLFNSHHLSMAQVKNPINDSKIGRWKKDLTEDMLKEFNLEAKNTLIELGYEV